MTEGVEVAGEAALVVARSALPQRVVVAVVAGDAQGMEAVVMEAAAAVARARAAAVMEVAEVGATAAALMVAGTTR